MSSEINAREGINLQCAKKAVEKIKYDYRTLDQTKKETREKSMCIPPIELIPIRKKFITELVLHRHPFLSSLRLSIKIFN